MMKSKVEVDGFFRPYCNDCPYMELDTGLLHGSDFAEGGSTLVSVRCRNLDICMRVEEELKKEKTP